LVFEKRINSLHLLGEGLRMGAANNKQQTTNNKQQTVPISYNKIL
jgi:hypothetical protein